jgi:hypothetical protein
MLQFNKLDVVIPHMNGELCKGYPRQIVLQRNIDELREAGVSMLCGTSVRFAPPVDMILDCDQVMSWLTNRLIAFKEAGFRLIELSAELRQVKLDISSKDEPAWDAFWSGTFIHAKGKDPRGLVKDCVHYSATV